MPSNLSHLRGLPPMNGVPLVGQRVEILGWFPTVNIACRCEAQPGIVMLHGMDRMTACPKCGVLWRIMSIAANPGTNEMSITVGQVVPAAPADPDAPAPVEPRPS